MSAAIAIQYTLESLALEAQKSTSALKEHYRLNRNTEGYQDLLNTPLSSNGYLTDRQTAFFFATYPPLSGQTETKVRKIADRIQTDRQTETERIQQLETEIINLRQTEADRQTELDRQRQTAKQLQTELDRIRQTETDRDKSRQTDLDRLRQENKDLKAEKTSLFNQLQALNSEKGNIDIGLNKTILEKDSEIKELHKDLNRQTDRIRQLEADLNRQTRQFQTELKQKFEEYETAFQTDRQAELERLQTEHAAKVEAEKKKLFFEQVEFAKYGLLMFTIIQVVVSAFFLEEYLKLNIYLAFPLGIPIAYGGLLSTMYLTTDSEKSNYLLSYTILFAIMEAAYFLPKCDWDASKIFGTLVYIVLMFVLGNSWARIYFKIK
jgi:hypothetical protein